MVLKLVLVVIVFQVQICFSIKNLNKTSEILYNLANYAIESRQRNNPCIYESDRYRYYSCLEKLGLYPKPPYYQNEQSIMDVLYTIAKNDALRCVPRLLCELTSDTISKSRQGFALPTLPFNIDMGSIIRLLASIDIPGGSPVPVFAKAALLGYASKGNSDSCLDAYPQCPRDPNKLVHYLNNYNGGFFRFFKGVDTRPHGLINYAQKRIQNKPVNFYKTVFFPTSEDNRVSELTFKKPKELPFSISDYYFNELDLQRPLPNHRVTPMIFPDRTGTGDLRLDSEELNENYHQTQYNLQNDFVSFKPEPTNEGSYYRVPEGEFNTNKAIFSFPV